MPTVIIIIVGRIIADFCGPHATTLSLILVVVEHDIPNFLGKSYTSSANTAFAHYRLVLCLSTIMACLFATRCCKITYSWPWLHHCTHFRHV